MAVVRIPEEGRTIRDPEQIRDFLASIDIQYNCWKPSFPAAPDASAEKVLEAFAEPIQRLKEQGGYVTADVIDVHPNTPGLDAMLAKFSKEHWHNEDEVRYIVEGRGLFHIHPAGKPVVAIEVEAGDLIRVPSGSHHWFDLCGDRRIRAIRLFQDTAGWTPHYTDTGVDARFQPVCLGPQYIPHDMVSPTD